LNIGIETLSSTAEVRLKKSFFIGVMLRSTGLDNLTYIDSSLDVGKVSPEIKNDVREKRRDDHPISRCGIGSRVRVCGCRRFTPHDYLSRVLASA
jgi:hypothetical protein